MGGLSGWVLGQGGLSGPPQKPARNLCEIPVRSPGVRQPPRWGKFLLLQFQVHRSNEQDMIVHLLNRLGWMWRNSVIAMFHSSSCVLKVCVIERSSSEWRPACLGCIIRLHTHSCQAAFPKLKTGGHVGPGGFSPAMFDPCFALNSDNNVDYKLGGAWWRNYAQAVCVWFHLCWKGHLKGLQIQNIQIIQIK